MIHVKVYGPNAIFVLREKELILNKLIKYKKNLFKYT